MPSSHITASLSFCLILTERHGIGRHFGSCVQGSSPTTVFENNKMSSSVLPIGPLTLFTASCPARPERAPKVGNRPNDGRRVKIPVHAAGIRREPPAADPSVACLTRIFHTYQYQFQHREGSHQMQSKPIRLQKNHRRSVPCSEGSLFVQIHC